MNESKVSSKRINIFATLGETPNSQFRTPSTYNLLVLLVKPPRLAEVTDHNECDRHHEH